MEETVFLADGRVTVTNATFLVASQSFAMGGITSAKASQHNPSRIGPAILVAVATAICLIARRVDMLSIALFLGGIAWWFLQKPYFHVILLTSSGEEEALTTKDKEWVQKVVAALNESIESNRGKGADRPVARR